MNLREENILDLIGGTPVVKIRHMNPNSDVSIYAKLEGFNPGGSVKDRICRSMIEAAEASGELTKGKIILEPTSGNTGIGLAMVATVKGYLLKIVMPETMSVERRKILTQLGAEIVLTPGDRGMNGAIEIAHEMAEDERYFMPDQFANAANPQAHYETTSLELLEQVPEMTTFVAGLGTGGTLMGVGRRLREERPEVHVVAVEPYQQSKIQGLRNLNDYIPQIWDESRIDEKVNVADKCAFYTARQLAKEEGILVGISSGAAMFEALRQARSMLEGTIVVVLPDGGEKYLSTELFD